MTMTLKSILLSLLFLFFSFSFIHAQGEIQLKQPLEANQIDDIWRINLINQTPQTLSVLLEVAIYDANGNRLYQAHSSPFSVVHGELLLQKDLVQPINILSTHLFDNRLPEGVFWFEVKAVEALSQRFLQQSKQKITIKSSSTTDEKKSVKNITSQGSIRVNYIKTPQLVTGTYLPPAFLRTDAQTTITAWGVPLNISALLSTEQVATQQPINQVNFSFDQQQLRYLISQQLMKQVEAYLSDYVDSSKIARLEQLKTTVLQRQFPKMERWRDELAKVPELESRLQAIQQVSNLDQVLQNPELLAKQTLLKQLEKQYGVTKESFSTDNIPNEAKQQLQNLYALQAEFDKIKVQKEKEKPF